MAKGNILLGMGRGKLGDIVLTRIDGQQIARPRNRQPKNPRTNKQLYQRAVMATVMQAYSAGIKIFDHSFEGKSVGAANQRYFMKINAKNLRAQIAEDLAAAEFPYNQACVVAPGVSTPVPNRFVVSEGSLPMTLINGAYISNPLEGEKCSEYCARMGLHPMDLYTIVCFGSRSTDVIFSVNGESSPYAQQINCSFMFMRIRLKATAFTDDTVLTGSNWDVLFDADSRETNDSLNYGPEDWGINGVSPNSIFGLDEEGAYAWIRSRVDEDLRSSATMRWGMRIDPVYGIGSQFALAAWKQGAASLGDSDLILEGGDE